MIARNSCIAHIVVGLTVAFSGSVLAQNDEGFLGKLKSGLLQLADDSSEGDESTSPETTPPETSEPSEGTREDSAPERGTPVEGGDSPLAPGGVPSENDPEGVSEETEDGSATTVDLFGKSDEPAESTEPEDESAGEDERRLTKLRQLASANIVKGRVRESMQAINELIIIRPYDPEIHLALGLCYRRLGKYDDATKKYQDVLDLGGPKGLISLLVAESLAAVGNKEGAFEKLRDAAISGRNIINDVGNLPLLREYRDDTEFIKLALQLEKFELGPPRKHDPFTNPFPKVQAVETDDTPTRDELFPEEQEKLLIDAKRTYQRVQFYIKIEDEDKAMHEYNQLREYFEQVHLVTVPKIAAEFQFLMNRMGDIEVQIEGIRLKFYYNQAREKLDAMRESFLDAEYAKVTSIHQDIQKLASEMTSANERYDRVAQRIVETSQQWVARAEVRQEFDERKPDVQGIVISEDGKMAVLNDRIVRQGEAIEEFRVVKVESNRVTFRYKGEEIPLVFRRY